LDFVCSHHIYLRPTEKIYNQEKWKCTREAENKKNPTIKASPNIRLFSYSFRLIGTLVLANNLSTYMVSTAAA